MAIFIRDSMVLFTSPISKYITLSENLHVFCQATTLVFYNITHGCWCFDRYDIIHSIKSAEQNSRSITHLKSNVLQVNKGRVIPDWNKFLDSGYNQQSLIICIFWKSTPGFLLDCWRPVWNGFFCVFFVWIFWIYYKHRGHSDHVIQIDITIVKEWFYSKYKIIAFDCLS